MSLSGQERELLQDALVNAFRNKSSLEQMLMNKLSKNLYVIAGGDDLETIVFNLINKADAEGWVKDLISAAHQSNPGNEKLQRVFLNLSPMNYDDSKINNLAKTAEEILEYVNLSFKENQNIIIPFLQNKSKREEVWKKLNFLLYGPQDIGKFSMWKALFEQPIPETEENPQLQDTINELLKILQQFHQSFYSYYSSYTENPEKYQMSKNTKYFVEHALNKEESGFTDEEVVRIAKDYLRYLGYLVNKMGEIIGRLKTMRS